MKWNWSLVRKRAFWIRAVPAIVLLLVALPIVGAAILPGNPLYPVKRIGESVLTFITPGISYQHVNAKEGVRAVYAARRLNEAGAMVERLDRRSVKKQASDADTIEVLLQQFDEVFSDITLNLSQTIDRGARPSEKFFTDIQKRSAELAVKLKHMRLEAPPTDQATVLRSIVIINNNLATIADALHQAPVSEGDAAELTKMVSAGLISKSDLTALLGQVNSNRRLLDLLREKVKSGQLPSGILYAMNFDLVTKLLPDQAPRYINSVRFDELRKVALLMKAVEPTPSQKKAIQDYLKSYKAGDLVPTNSLTRYTAPLIYGWHLVEAIGVDTSVIEPEHMSPERRIFYELWAPHLNKTNVKTPTKQSSFIVSRALAQEATTVTTQKAPTYDQVLSSADIGVIKSSTLLDRVQLELLKALRSEVAYMALPPGWIGSDIMAMSESFKQSTEALKANEAVQAKTDQAVAQLATVTAPLQAVNAGQAASATQATDATKAIDGLRAEMKTEIENLRTQLVQNTYNSTFTTVNNTTVVNQDTTTIDNNIEVLRQKFNQSLTSLETKLTADNQTAGSLTKQELAALKTAANESLDELKDAQTDLKEQIAAQTELITRLKKTITGLEVGQATLIDDLASARKETAANLDAAITNVKEFQAGNLASLQSQLTDQVSQAGALELSLIGLVQAQAEQKAALEAEINLSAADRATLKAQVNQAVADLAAAQAKNITDLESAIAAAEGRGQSQINETKQAVSELKSTQTDLAKSLKEFADDKELLRSQLTTVVADVRAVQDATNAAVQKLTTDQSSLLTSVQQITTSQAGTITQLASLDAETKVLRSELQQSVTDLTAAQAAATQDLHSAVLALGSQLTQSIGEVANAQTQANTRLDGVEAKTVTLDAAIAGITEINLQVQTDLAAEIAETKTIQDQLAQSLTALAQAQIQTAAEVATIKSDVSTVKQSVADIKAAQIAADVKVNDLLAASVDWSTLAASVKVDINALNQLQTNLNADFAAKSAALDAQFQTYQQHVNDDINRLSTETDAQILRLRQEADALKTQIQQLQSATTTSTTTTTTTPTATSTPTLGL
ncbi:MAG: hypothetical protein WAP74_03065 [Patescibacteria group bacterium]